jgi:hypothetical protein
MTQLKCGTSGILSADCVWRAGGQELRGRGGGLSRIVGPAESHYATVDLDSRPGSVITEHCDRKATRG